ncbi:MAG TPA: acyltransferase [Thermoleophilia bacterium]|nr:acyltransferase [Thermoleophilia bacterium]
MNVTTDIQRRHDIDWLRIGAVLLLFPFHVARIFNVGEDFYVRDVAANSTLSYIVEILNPWHMPLLFLLAGASTWFALSHRGAGGYALERVKRLLIPFLFGMLVLVPPQSYLGLVSHGGVHDSFFAWFPNFFHTNPDDPSGYFMGGRTLGHLWFIIHLFFYSVLALPIVLLLRHRIGKRAISWLAKLAERRGIILLFALFLCVAIPFPDMYGGNPVYLGMFFLLGYVLMSDNRFERAIDRHKFAALLLGFVPCVGIAYFEVRGWPAVSWPLAAPLVDFAHYLLVPWFCMIAMLGYGRRLLSFSNRFLKYAAQASYPVYLLHQTVIVAAGFAVLKLGAGVPLSYTAILVGSLAGSFLGYELVRRVNVLRFLFGMRIVRKKVSVPRPEPVPEGSPLGSPPSVTAQVLVARPVEIHPAMPGTNNLTSGSGSID